MADVHINETQVPAQTTGPAHPEADKVDVHETAVVIDTVITDPHSDLAVQIPDAGRGSALTPIGQTYSETPNSPEEVFAAEAKSSAKPKASPDKK